MRVSDDHTAEALNKLHQSREKNVLDPTQDVGALYAMLPPLGELQDVQVQSLKPIVAASQKLVERTDVRTAAQEIVETLVTTFGVRLAWIGSAEPDGLVKPLYWAGDVADYLKDVEIRWDDSPLGQGPAGRAIRAGKPVVMDIATDPGFAPWSQPALAHGYREVAAFPLIRRTKPFGHLILYSSATGFFTPGRVELVQTYANIATTALESARLVEEAQRQAAEQATLSAIATATSQSLQIGEVLQIALDKVLEVSGRERGYIRLRDPATQQVTLAAHRGLSANYTEVLLQSRSPGGKTDQVFTTGEPLVVNDPTGTPRTNAIRKQGDRSTAWVPLKAQGKVLGVLNISTARPVPFTAREIELLQAIGSVIGVAVENARLFEESKRQEKIQTLLKELSQDITALDIESLFKKMTDNVREFFKADIVDLRLLEGDNRRVVGSSGTALARLDSVKKIRGRVAWIVGQRKPLVIADLSEDLSMSTGETIRQLHLRGYVGIPLFGRSGKVIGVLRALTYQPRQFSQSEIDLLQQLANGTAIAIENARLFEETQRGQDEQAAINAIAMATTGSLHMNELLNIALAKVLEVTGRKRGSIKLKDLATGRVVLAAHQGLSEKYAETIRRHLAPEEKASEIFDSGEVVVVNDPEKSLFNLSEHEAGLRSLIWVPLKARGTVIGILNVSTPLPKPFTAREIELLKNIGNVIGIAVENARLFEETERRAREQAALYAVTAAVGNSFDLDQTFQQGLDAVLEATGMDGGYIYMLDGEPPRITLKAHRGMSKSFISRMEGERQLGPKTAQIIATKQPLVFENVPPDHRGKFRGEHITAAAWVPISSKDKVVGILAVCTRNEPSFPHTQIPLFSSIGNALGVALENARLFQETDRHLKRVQALREIDQAISSTLDLQNVLHILLEKIDLSLPYATATIRLFDQESGLLEPVACRNLDEKEWKAEQWRAGRGTPNVVFETKAPLVIRDVRIDARVRDVEFCRKHNLVSYLGVPLIVKEEVIGVLGFYTKEEHEFTGEETNFLATLAGQAAIAIHNSQLYENARLREAQLEKSNRMLSALHAAAAAASQSLDLKRVLEAVVGKIRDIFGFTTTHVHIYDDATDELVLRYGLEKQSDASTAPKKFKRGEGIVGTVAATGTRLIFEDVQSDPLYRKLSAKKLAVARRHHFFAVLPIRGKLKNLGTLACTGIEARKLTESEMKLLEALTDHLAVAIENSKLYDELKEKIGELERANKVKDEFLSVMSHELRTPLNVVIGYAGLIREGMLGVTNREQNKALDKLVSRTNDLLAMITDILYATSIEAEEVRVDNSRFPLRDLLAELKRTYAAPLPKPVQLEWDYSPDLPVVSSDRDKVRCILQSLISNGIKFTEKGRVTIAARRLEDSTPNRGTKVLAPSAAGWIEFKVSDSGIGIAEEKLPLIFDKFRQADSSETRQYGGVGLGLYIAKSFTEMLGGRISVETVPGKGSTFTVTLPRDYAAGSVAAAPGARSKAEVDRYDEMASKKSCDQRINTVVDE